MVQHQQHQRMLQIYALSLSLQVASMKFAEEDFIILSNPLGNLVPQQSVKLLVRYDVYPAKAQANWPMESRTQCTSTSMFLSTWTASLEATLRQSLGA